METSSPSAASYKVPAPLWSESSLSWPESSHWYYQWCDLHTPAANSALDGSGAQGQHTRLATSEEALMPLQSPTGMFDMHRDSIPSSSSPLESLLWDLCPTTQLVEDFAVLQPSKLASSSANCHTVWTQELQLPLRGHHLLPETSEPLSAAGSTMDEALTTAADNVAPPTVGGQTRSEVQRPRFSGAKKNIICGEPDVSGVMCNSTFTRNTDRTRHLASSKHVSHKDDSTKRYACLRSNCSMAFTRTDHRTDHMRRMHDPDIPKTYKGRSVKRRRLQS